MRFDLTLGTKIRIWSEIGPLSFWGALHNFVVIFEFEHFCKNLKNGSIDFLKTLNTYA